MSLLIKLGDLYSSRRHRRTREVAKAHVWAHFVREQLKNRRVRIATVRPTGWHPENNAGGSGWHLTVDFRTRNKVHVTTHHIYYDAGPRKSQKPAAPSPPSSPSPSLPRRHVTVTATDVPIVALPSRYRRRHDWGRAGRVGGVPRRRQRHLNPHGRRDWDTMQSASERRRPHVNGSPTTPQRRGCLLDSEGRHSVTPEAIVTQIAELSLRCRRWTRSAALAANRLPLPGHMNELWIAEQICATVIIARPSLVITWDRAASQLTPFSVDNILVRYNGVDQTVPMSFRPLWDWAVDLISPQLIDRFVWDAQHIFRHNGETMTHMALDDELSSSSSDSDHDVSDTEDLELIALAPPLIPLAADLSILKTSQLDHQMFFDKYKSLKIKYEELLASSSLKIKRSKGVGRVTLAGESTEISRAGGRFSVVGEPWVDRLVFAIPFPGNVDPLDPARYNNSTTENSALTAELYKSLPKHPQKALANDNQRDTFRDIVSILPKETRSGTRKFGTRSAHT
ncbi:hypothetical protein EDB84DRAFT_1437306 [Lactarius hengduanensis]|nr:hypothetical protein EDB84DRAFT_1440622 [Lactarius hengduanensis]KAH9035082.1 hypothetical protein EDB84DRAFT_1437995 [Lactarius hengduanensis]KAH9037936.1 hypothetical protein EDB84DRAFT_1437306 [Lactarius hengduanensis]